MAIKVTPEIIKQINVRYAECHNKAQVAREIGCSAGTVSKYIIPDYEICTQRQTVKIDDLPPCNWEKFRGDLAELCCLSDEEKEEMKALWKEIG